MAKGFAQYGFRDYNGEASGFRIRIAEITTAIDANVAALQTAVNGVQAGTPVNSTFRQGNETLDNSPRADTAASQRELKWLVRYKDATTNDVYTVEIPCADTAHLDVNNRGFAELDDAGDVAAFVSAFEAVALAPNTGNATEVVSMQLVGRNI